MAFKLKGYSAFTQDTGDMPDVVVTPKIEGIRNEIEKIKNQLKTMDPNDPEAKLLRKLLNLKKNR